MAKYIDILSQDFKESGLKDSFFDAIDDEIKNSISKFDFANKTKEQIK